MDKLSKLEQLLKETNTKQEFNIVDDLKSLELLHGLLNPKSFLKKIKTLISKYQSDELTVIREALVERCRQGDTNAIRLYAEYFKPTVVDDNDDGLLEALESAGKEVFADEV